jgi:hypothetical protein
MKYRGTPLILKTCPEVLAELMILDFALAARAEITVLVFLADFNIEVSAVRWHPKWWRERIIMM